MNLVTAFLSFFLYSFIGWFYETTVCSYVKYKKFINRGFLMGPLCPIYGVGAVVCYLLFHEVNSPLALFLSAAIVCSILEYVTSYAMEKLFHARWWDYSHFPFNLNGRVCLYGAVLFGAGCVWVCRLSQPGLLRFFDFLTPFVCYILFAVLMIVFIVDITITLCSFRNLNAHLKALYDQYEEKANLAMEEISEQFNTKTVPKFEHSKQALTLQIQEKLHGFKKGELHFLRAFPSLEFHRYKKVITTESIKELFSKRKQKH